MFQISSVLVLAYMTMQTFLGHKMFFYCALEATHQHVLGTIYDEVKTYERTFGKVIPVSSHH